MEPMAGARDVGEFITQRYGAVSALAELGGGDWSRAYCALDGKALVVRFGEYPEDFEKDRAAMEFAGPDLPIPKVLEIGDTLGGAYVVSERHDGAFLESLDIVCWQAP